MINSNTMQWIDVVLPECVICGSKAAAVFLNVNNQNICFSCCDQIRLMTEERIKESMTRFSTHNINNNNRKKQQYEGCNC